MSTNPQIGPATQAVIDIAAKDLVRELVIEGLKKEFAVNPEMREIVRTEIMSMCNGSESALMWLANDGLDLAIAYLRYLEGEQKTRQVFSGLGVGR